ncbi:MAG: cytochrome c3 family protein [Desulfobacteraceae bacterium]|nr:cytochrome c3 family protein [Desulfobacteraceae bacterium]
MTSKKQRMIVYGVAIHLLLVAIVCYAAFPVQEPEEPIRLMYQVDAGNVLFDHQGHASGTGYGLACNDCHHSHPEGEDLEPVACFFCHKAKPENKEPIPETCLDCHEDESELEDSEIPKRSDAFHKQCTECHEEFGKGPKSGSDYCSMCHVL